MKLRCITHLPLEDKIAVFKYHAISKIVYLLLSLAYLKLILMNLIRPIISFYGQIKDVKLNIILCVTITFNKFDIKLKILSLKCLWICIWNNDAFG